MTSLPAVLVESILNPAFLAAALATAVAGLMRGYSGFGTAVLLAPVFATLWGPRAGVPIVLLMELLVSAQLLPKAIGEADRRMVLPIALAAVAVMPVGSLVLLQADGTVLRRAIGVLVLVFGFILLSPWRYRGARPLGLNVLVGAVSGLLKGSTGMAGPPVIFYFLAGVEEARRHRANFILFFGVVGVASIIPPFLAGLIDAPALIRSAALLPVLLLCVRTGTRLFHVIPVTWYRRFAFGALVVAGGIALLG